jgi:6-pyruvoyltetrahydropterin/6-carboxytetrahydropterin synthase
MTTHVTPQNLAAKSLSLNLETRIGRTYKFESAHHLPLLPEGHKCKNMHGHNYRIEVVVRGTLDPRGFVMDFAEIDAEVMPLIKRVDGYDVRHVNGTQSSADRSDILRTFAEKPKAIVTNS